MDRTLPQNESDTEIKYHYSKTEAENVQCNAFYFPSIYSGNFSFEMDTFLKTL